MHENVGATNLLIIYVSISSLYGQKTYEHVSQRTKILNRTLLVLPSIQSHGHTKDNHTQTLILLHAVVGSRSDIRKCMPFSGRPVGTCLKRVQ